MYIRSTKSRYYDEWPSPRDIDGEGFDGLYRRHSLFDKVRRYTVTRLWCRLFHEWKRVSSRILVNPTILHFKKNNHLSLPNVRCTQGPDCHVSKDSRKAFLRLGYLKDCSSLSSLNKDSLNVYRSRFAKAGVQLSWDRVVED